MLDRRRNVEVLENQIDSLSRFEQLQRIHRVAYFPQRVLALRNGVIRVFYFVDQFEQLRLFPYWPVWHLYSFEGFTLGKVESHRYGEGLFFLEFRSLEEGLQSILNLLPLVPQNSLFLLELFERQSGSLALSLQEGLLFDQWFFRTKGALDSGWQSKEKWLFFLHFGLRYGPSGRTPRVRLFFHPLQRFRSKCECVGRKQFERKMISSLDFGLVHSRFYRTRLRI